jgi:hypothetical protein
VSTTTAAVTLTPTSQAVQLAQPQGLTSSAVVIDNLSTYLLTVRIGANVYYQAPLVQAKYDLTDQSGAPVVINPIVLAGDTSTTGTVAPTWYGFTSDDQYIIATGRWPIALSGPAEVAAATAAALLAQGIPNVFVQNQLLAPTLLPAPGTGVGSSSVASYASVIVHLSSGATRTQVRVDWRAPGIGNYWSSDFLFAPSDAPNTTWMLPVVGATFTLNNTLTGAATTATVFGTNRQITKPIMLQLGDLIPRFFGVGSPWTAGTAYRLANFDSFAPLGGGQDCTFFNGTVTITFEVSTGVAGILSAVYVGPDGTLQTMPVLTYPATGGVVTTRFDHPGIPLQWWWTPATAVAGAGQVAELFITPGIF